MERSCRFPAFQDDVHPLDRFLSWHRLQQDEGQTSEFGGAFVEDDGHGKCNRWMASLRNGIYVNVRKGPHYIFNVIRNVNM